MPALTPVAIPVEEPNVAKEILPELQVPPPDASVSCMLDDTHTGIFPVMIAGNGFIVIDANPIMLLRQPVVGLIAEIVYTPAGCMPKSRGVPVDPAIAVPTVPDAL